MVEEFFRAAAATNEGPDSRKYDRYGGLLPLAPEECVAVDVWVQSGDGFVSGDAAVISQAVRRFINTCCQIFRHTLTAVT